MYCQKRVTREASASSFVYFHRITFSCILFFYFPDTTLLFLTNRPGTKCKLEQVLSAPRRRASATTWGSLPPYRDAFQ